MIYIICLIVSLISIFLLWFLDQKDCDIGSFIIFIIALPTTLAAIFMTIVILLNLCTLPNDNAKNLERYQSLNTRIENHMYSAEDRVELIEAVQDWNERLAGLQSAKNNIWTVIFNLESIERLDKIDLERIK